VETQGEKTGVDVHSASLLHPADQSHDLSISLPFNTSSSDEPASEPAEHPHRAFKSSHLALDLVVATWWLDGEVIYEQLHLRVPDTMALVYVQGETAPST
jgi:hypothetical protein